MSASRWHTKQPTEADRQRKRQYNSKTHKAELARCKALVATGTASCWRCGKHLPATAVCGRDWHTGHDDHDRSIYRGPECATCNRSAGARKAARQVNAARQGQPPPYRRVAGAQRPPRPSRDW